MCTVTLRKKCQPFKSFALSNIKLSREYLLIRDTEKLTFSADDHTDYPHLSMLCSVVFHIEYA